MKVYFSSRLKAPSLFTALDANNIAYGFIENTRDIWVRDFMPVKVRNVMPKTNKSEKYISFRYEPSYLANEPKLRTDYKTDIAAQFPELSVIYDSLNLDGGNIVFSPSRCKAIVSDRVFAENPLYNHSRLIAKLSQRLRAEIIIIPALPPKDDTTGHADGMVRFVDENTVIGNGTGDKHEEEIKAVLSKHGIITVDFPYFESRGISAVGCYINFLETENHIFLPVFEVDMQKDNAAVALTEKLFKKKVVPVNINQIAAKGGALNCVSWEL